MRWPSGERNLDRKELRFRLAGDVEVLGGGMEDMAQGRYQLHPSATTTTGRRRQHGEGRGEGRAPDRRTTKEAPGRHEMAGEHGRGEVGQIPPRRWPCGRISTGSHAVRFQTPRYATEGDEGARERVMGESRTALFLRVTEAQGRDGDRFTPATKIVAWRDGI